MPTVYVTTKEILMIYSCKTCGYHTRFSFMTNYKDLMPNRDLIYDLLEKSPCRYCRLETMEKKQLHEIYRRFQRDYTTDEVEKIWRANDDL